MRVITGACEVQITRVKYIYLSTYTLMILSNRTLPLAAKYHVNRYEFKNKAVKCSAEVFIVPYSPA